MKKLKNLGVMLSKEKQKTIKGGLVDPGEGGGCANPGGGSYNCTITNTDCSTYTDTSTGDSCGCAKMNWYRNNPIGNTWSVDCCGSPTPCN